MNQNVKDISAQQGVQPASQAPDVQADGLQDSTSPRVKACNQDASAGQSKTAASIDSNCSEGIKTPANGTGPGQQPVQQALTSKANLHHPDQQAGSASADDAPAAGADIHLQLQAEHQPKDDSSNQQPDGQRPAAEGATSQGARTDFLLPPPSAIQRQAEPTAQPRSIPAPGASQQPEQHFPAAPAPPLGVLLHDAGPTSIDSVGPDDRTESSLTHPDSGHLLPSTYLGPTTTRLLHPFAKPPPQKKASRLGFESKDPLPGPDTPEVLSASSLGVSDTTTSTGPLESIHHISAPTAGAGSTSRRPPDRHASMPSFSHAAAPAPSTSNQPPQRTASMNAQTCSTACSTPAAGRAPASAFTSRSQSSASVSVIPMDPADFNRKAAALKATPSRLSSAAMARCSLDSFGRDIMASADGRPSGGTVANSRLLLSSHHSASLVTLQKTVEHLMHQDSEMLVKIQSSMRGISSLAKETSNLEVGRDATGATCINQYVVVKTLGRGSFGKVKLCLNTLDGNLYAIKMVNRSFIAKQLQKPQKGLRRRVPTRHASGSTFQVMSAANVTSSGPPADIHRSALSISNAGNSPTLAVSPSANSTGNMLGNDPRRALSSQHVEAHQTSAGSTRMSIDEAGVNPLESVMREIAVLKKMDHPNVVKLHEVIDPPGASYMMLVMEYMERGPVIETKGQTGFTSFPERVARDYFRQACAGLDYLHYNHVVHGDLKPENLLVTAAGQLKIGDFGSARMMSDSSASSKVSCTPAFQPPEALTNPGFEDPHSADVWALGVCLYCFIYGRLPFTGSCLLDVSNAIRNDPLTFPSEVRITPELQDLLVKVLCKEPGQRISLQGMMEHPWVTEDGKSPLPSMSMLLSPVVEVSKNEAQLAIDRSSLVSMIRARLKEKTFTPGEFLFREGDEAHCIFMIMSGVVEITSRLQSAMDPSLVDDIEEQSFSVDLDESFTLDCHQFIPEGMDTRNGKLHIDRRKAQALKDRMRGMIMGRQNEYVTEVKGPGQVIGDVGMDKHAMARHTHSARARDHVTVVKLTEESFLKALMQQADAGGGGGGGDGEEALFSARNIDEVDSLNGPGGSTGLHTILDADVGEMTLS